MGDKMKNKALDELTFGRSLAHEDIRAAEILMNMRNSSYEGSSSQKSQEEPRRAKPDVEEEGRRTRSLSYIYSLTRPSYVPANPSYREQYGSPN